MNHSWLILAACAGGAYLVGAIPFGLLLGRLEALPGVESARRG